MNALERRLVELEKRLHEPVDPDFADVLAFESCSDDGLEAFMQFRELLVASVDMATIERILGEKRFSDAIQVCNKIHEVIGLQTEFQDILSKNLKPSGHAGIQKMKFEL